VNEVKEGDKVRWHWR